MASFSKGVMEIVLIEKKSHFWGDKLSKLEAARWSFENWSFKTAVTVRSQSQQEG